MNDRLNHNTGTNYYYPGFARYGLDMARAMTAFLHSDPSAPFANQPDNWHRTGLIRITTRRLLFSALATATTSAATDFRPSNGKNYLILWRSAVAVVNAGTTSVNTDLINAGQTQADGTIIDDTVPISANYGSGEQPYVYAVPDFVVGTSTRRFTLTNNSGSTADIYLAFAIAYLDA